MGIINLCFCLRVDLPNQFSIDSAEQEILPILNKFLSILYTHAKYFFTLSLTGDVLEWLEMSHPEIINILSELSSRKQIEVLGGGYYDPCFPLLLPVDRVGQAEMLTTELRRTIGKRPRGAFLSKSIWDPCIISSLKTCGFEYVFLHNNIISNSISEASCMFYPYVVEDSGKTLIVLPYFQNKLPKIRENTVDYYKKLGKLTNKDEDCCISILLDINTLIDCYSNNDLERIFTEIDSTDELSFLTPSKYLKNNKIYKKITITAGTESELLSVKSIFNRNKEMAFLYSHLIHTGLVVNQCRGDKSRKKAARLELWQAQNYKIFWYPDDSFACDIRLKAYKHLLLAEKAVQESNGYSEYGLSSFDYDMDGYKDYFCSYPNYNSVLSTDTGSILELDLKKSCSIYTAMLKADDDQGVRKIFSDYLLPDDELQNITKGVMNNEYLFSGKKYVENSFSHARHEVLFYTENESVKKNQIIQLKKKFCFSENGIQVQYIVKNTGNQTLKAIFAVESNFALPSIDNNTRVIEVLAGNSKQLVCSNQLYVKQKNVLCIKITDETFDNSLIYETNEDTNVVLKPLFINKKFYSNSCIFYWKVNISPDHEIEKTISLNIKQIDSNTLLKKARKRIVR